MAYSNNLLCFSYACSSLSEDNIKNLKYSGKMLLPPSVLHDVDKMKHKEFPLFFNVKNKDTEFGRVCAVQEFTASPGTCNIPYYIMNEIGIFEEGNEVVIELASPVKGSYVKLQPHQKEFIQLSDPKALLEQIMSQDYPVVTENHTIAINHKALNRIFYIDIIKTEPGPVIQIINTDINVEFDVPLDAVNDVSEATVMEEDQSKSEISEELDQLKNSMKDNKFIPFSGKGNRLGRE